MSAWFRSVVAGTSVLFAAGLFVFAGCGQTHTVQAAKVRTAGIQEFVDEQGKTRLPDVQEITMPYAGRIKPISVREGEAVTKGQVVVEVDPVDLANELAEAKAGVERAEASIVENDDVAVEEGARQQALKFVEAMVSTVAASEARKISGKKKLDFAEANLARTKALWENSPGARSKEDMERMELLHVEAEVDYQQDVLTAASIKAIDAATRLLPTMVADYISRKGLTHNVLAKQKSEAEARLRAAERKNERGKMKSPIDGVVLDREESDEQYLAAGALLLKIGDLTQLEAEADILSQEVVRVQPGQAVEIYGPAVGASEGNGVRGHVSRIYPAGFTKLSSLGVEQQRVKVIVEFEDGVLDKLRERNIGVDYRVRVRIFTAEKTNTLVIPRSAVFRAADGGWQAFAVENGRARLRPVELGLMNDETVEVRSGLTADESVVLAPENQLQDGSRVRMIQR